MTERVLVSVSIGAAVGGAAIAAAIGLLAGIARGARAWTGRRERDRTAVEDDGDLVRASR